MTYKTITLGLAALVVAVLPAPGRAQPAASDYQTLASAQFPEPKPLGDVPLKIVLRPAEPLAAELAQPVPQHRILMVVRGTRQRGAPVIPLSVYWNLPDGSSRLDQGHLLGHLTLEDRFGGKEHTSVIDVTDRLRELAAQRPVPEPLDAPQPGVTLVNPEAGLNRTGPQIEEVLLVAGATKSP